MGIRCFAGMITQEAYQTRPELVKACARNISGHARTLETEVRAAIERYGAPGKWSAEGLALHMQAVIQGAFILAKAKGEAAVVADNIDHLRRYLELLFRADSHAEPGAHATTSMVGVAANHSLSDSDYSELNNPIAAMASFASSDSAPNHMTPPRLL